MTASNTSVLVLSYRASCLSSVIIFALAYQPAQYVRQSEEVVIVVLGRVSSEKDVHTLSFIIEHIYSGNEFISIVRLGDFAQCTQSFTYYSDSSILVVGYVGIGQQC